MIGSATEPRRYVLSLAKPTRNIVFKKIRPTKSSASFSKPHGRYQAEGDVVIGNTSDVISFCLGADGFSEKWLIWLIAVIAAAVLSGVGIWLVWYRRKYRKNNKGQ